MAGKPQSLFIAISVLLHFGRAFGQAPTFAKDIAPIIYQKCTPCHKAGGIGPMPFTNYKEVREFGLMIKKVTGNGYMPPWLADTAYRHYANEITLAPAEVKKIGQWVDGGYALGKASAETSWHNYADTIAEKPSLILGMQQAYRVEGNNRDNYREFVLPVDLPQDKYVSAIRFKPGSRAVHHAWIFFDEQHIGRRFDSLDADYGYNAFARMDDGSMKKIPGYLPGLIKRQYPDSMGVLLKKGADIVIQIHYAPVPVSTHDSSSIEMFFADKPVKQEVQFMEMTEYRLATIKEKDVEDLKKGDLSVFAKHLFIPAGETKTFVEKMTVLGDMSLISIIPHMHYRGKQFTAYAVSGKDTIPLIRIKNWDFDWQNAYLFKEPLRIPAGAIIYVEATFDNTSQNRSNPQHPPADASFGFGSKDEMLQMSMEFIR
jgi:hypothetical protein